MKRHLCTGMGPGMGMDDGGALEQPNLEPYDANGDALHWAEGVAIRRTVAEGDRVGNRGRALALRCTHCHPG